MTTEIEPGAELYGCQLFTVPLEGLYIQRQKVKFSDGGHHIILYRTPYSSIPDHDENGESVDAAAFHDCSAGATSRWRTTGVIGGSESFNGDGMLADLPDGVALAIKPGTVLLMSTHYLNATPSPITVDARINLYTIPKEEVEVEAGVLYLDNPILRVPALGTSTARMRCPITHDISIASLQSHMHRRGSAFSAYLLNGGDDDDGDGDGDGEPEELYSTKSWAEPSVKALTPPRLVGAGTSIETRCEYQNTESRDVVHGLTSDDEMCQLIGAYYPADERLESCQDDAGEIAATWIGEGDSACCDAWSCMQGKSPKDADGGLAYFGCILDTCPGVSEEVSALARCQLSNGHGACDEACKNEKQSTACNACIKDTCGGEIDACLAAKCGAAK